MEVVAFKGVSLDPEQPFPNEKTTNPRKIKTNNPTTGLPFLGAGEAPGDDSKGTPRVMTEPLNDLGEVYLRSRSEKLLDLYQHCYYNNRVGALPNGVGKLWTKYVSRKS